MWIPKYNCLLKETRADLLAEMNGFGRQKKNGCVRNDPASYQTLSQGR